MEETTLRFETTIHSMIIEQGDSWLASGADRSEPLQAVVVTDNPERCWRITHTGQRWIFREDKLDVRELANFFAAFGSHWNILIESQVRASGRFWPVRAFIKNGRKHSQEWSVSLDCGDGT